MERHTADHTRHHNRSHQRLPVTATQDYYRHLSSRRAGLHTSTGPFEPGSLLSSRPRYRGAPIIPSVSTSLTNRPAQSHKCVHKVQCHGNCCRVLFVYIIGAGGIMFQQHSCGKDKGPSSKGPVALIFNDYIWFSAGVSNSIT